MKNTFFLFVAALLFSVAASAQSTVDSINAKYKMLPMPEALTLEKAFPVLGVYQLNTTDSTQPAETVTISMDSTSKGMVWVEGLPVGKFRAFLRQSPATYRIIAQKTESGKQIQEGTLIFDPATSTLSIALGKKYDAAAPAAIFAMNGDVAADIPSGTEVKVKSKTATSKTKSKVVFYTATKADAATTANNSVITEQQPQQPQQQQ
jgi:hypothetical protein